MSEKKVFPAIVGALITLAVLALVAYIGLVLVLPMLSMM